MVFLPGCLVRFVFEPRIYLATGLKILSRWEATDFWDDFYAFSETNRTTPTTTNYVARYKLLLLISLECDRFLGPFLAPSKFDFGQPSQNRKQGQRPRNYLATDVLLSGGGAPALEGSAGSSGKNEHGHLTYLHP